MVPRVEILVKIRTKKPKILSQIESNIPWGPPCTCAIRSFPNNSQVFLQIELDLLLVRILVHPYISIWDVFGATKKPRVDFWRFGLFSATIFLLFMTNFSPWGWKLYWYVSFRQLHPFMIIWDIFGATKKPTADFCRVSAIFGNFSLILTNF